MFDIIYIISGVIWFFILFLSYRAFSEYVFIHLGDGYLILVKTLQGYRVEKGPGTVWRLPILKSVIKTEYTYNGCESKQEIDIPFLFRFSTRNKISVMTNLKCIGEVEDLEEFNKHVLKSILKKGIVPDLREHIRKVVSRVVKGYLEEKKIKAVDLITEKRDCIDKINDYLSFFDISDIIIESKYIRVDMSDMREMCEDKGVRDVMSKDLYFFLNKKD